MTIQSERHIILFEDDRVEQFFPLTETRPLSEIRVGLHTQKERWLRYFKGKIDQSTRPYLQALSPLEINSDGLYINSALVPDLRMAETIKALQIDQVLVQDKMILAYSGQQLSEWRLESIPDKFEKIEYAGDLVVLEMLTDVFSKNDQIIRMDFELLKGKQSQSLPAGNILIGPESQLFIEPGAKVSASIINTESGPVYIGHGAEVMEGCMIRGPFVLGDHSTLKMGAKIYGATTIGPHSKIGGEVSNSVITGYSNKAHDGFLGNSVIGEWCNIGADSNNSNLKNNYAPVTLWNKVSGTFEETGLTFCGLMMGDHSKCGINSMFNTGTVIGTSCNLFGGGYMPRFVPSFSWGGEDSLVEHEFSKAMDTVSRVMARRDLLLVPEYRAVLQHISDISRRYHTDRIRS